MSDNHQVVITGSGVVSPIGIGRAAYWDSLATGRSGVGTSAHLSECGMPVVISAEVEDFEPKKYVKPRKSLKVMCREIQFAFAASVLAIEDAGLSPQDEDPDRFGVVLGSEMFYGEFPEMEDAYRHCMVNGKFDFELWGGRAMARLYPLWMLKYLPNMAACQIGIANDARGPNNTISSGESSSLLAIGEAARVIQRGLADVMITGGTGNRLNVTPQLYRGHSNLSHRNDDPASASRPFDARRDGMVNGEGAACFILESAEHAAKRKATVQARLLGFGCGYERRDASREGSGISLSIRRAIADAGLRPEDIGYVNAHGVSTVADDPIEAQAIHRTLGEVPVTAPKSYFGYLGAGGGAVEMAASVIGFEKGLIPPTLNYQHPDEQCPVRVVASGPIPMGKSAVAVLSQSATGQDSAIVIAAP
jgi:3-oxoacyl-[acyl-carrier-protein] synthase II